MIGGGDRFPDVALPDQDGQPVRVLDGDGPVVLFFYPADHTPGCTKEVCSFRDEYAEFQQHGARVMGISSDDAQKHRSFIAKHGLPFPLLVDEGGALAKQLGIPKVLGILGGRVTFVVDVDGVVRHVFKSQLQATRHIPEALQALQRLETA